MSARATVVDPGGVESPRWAPRAATVAAVVVSAVSALVAVGAGAADGLPTGVVAISALTGLTLAASLVLVRVSAVPVCVTASTAAVLLPIDASAALISLAWVVATASRRATSVCLVLTGAGTAASLARDALREPSHVVLAAVDKHAGAPAADPGPGAFLAAGVLLMSLSLAAGLAIRARDAAARAAADQEAQATAAAVLRDRTSRQEERALIAREVHDTVAHHMAEISLEASALEVTRSDDPETTRTARRIRVSAQQAVGELRSLVTTLRSGDELRTYFGATLDDLRTLVDGWAASDPGVTGTVKVADGADAAPRLVRAAFRIVQEAATNAHKHARGAAVDIRVQASPGSGVDITVVNPLLRAGSSDRLVPSVPGTGTGLLGMKERADAAGGTLVAGPDGGEFAVRAHLPWAGRDDAHT